MNDLLVQLICAHLMGDFLLQNDYAAKYKGQYTVVCLCHVVMYGLPFLIVRWIGCPEAPLWIFYAILIQHFLQDRYQLHLRWMELYRQTPPDKWPTGPLCVDQAMHIGFIWIITLFV